MDMDMSHMMMYFHTSITDAVLWSSWQPRTEVQYAFTFLAIVVLAIGHRALVAYAHVWERRTRVRNLKKGSVLVQKVNARSEADIDAVDAVLINDTSGQGGARDRSTSESCSNSSTLDMATTAEKQNGARTTMHRQASSQHSALKVPILTKGSVPLSQSSSRQGAADSNAAQTTGAGALAEEDALRVANPWRASVDLPRGLLQFFQSGLGYLLMLIVMTANAGYFFAVLAGIFIGEVAFGRFAKPPVLFPVRHRDGHERARADDGARGREAAV